MKKWHNSWHLHCLIFHSASTKYPNIIQQGYMCCINIIYLSENEHHYRMKLNLKINTELLRTFWHPYFLYPFIFSLPLLHTNKYTVVWYIQYHTTSNHSLQKLLKDFFLKQAPQSSLQCWIQANKILHTQSAGERSVRPCLTSYHKSGEIGHIMSLGFGSKWTELVFYSKKQMSRNK